ncbi:unnamed protein product [Ilex paraguariensis]|uniref:AAA+ ATPase domain-containing protein n=1 Tax=Ilex paraguariensis TaxID=185542 RepID=A0ABC8S5Z7_9AQUA
MTRAVRDRILKDVNGNISDHLRNHIHLTNCIHLKNHMHKHSPILADRALIRDLVVLQRSRSLRDPSTSPPSWLSPSVIDLLSKRGETDGMVGGRRSVGIERQRDGRGFFESSPPLASVPTSKVIPGEVSMRNGGGATVSDRSSKSGVQEKRRVNREESSGRNVGNDLMDGGNELQQDVNDLVHDNVLGHSESWDKKIRQKGKHRKDDNLKTLSEQLNEVPVDSDDVVSSNIHHHGRQTQFGNTVDEAEASIRGYSRGLNRVRRNKFRGARKTRAAIPSRDAGPENEMSVASNSLAQGAPCPTHNIEEGEEEFAEQNVTRAPRNGCGIPWNWSRVHHRGKSFLDIAGKSLSCGLSDPKLKRGSSSTVPLLVDASGSLESTDNAAWVHDYSGELGIYADNLLKHEIDSDLASEARSGDQHKYQGHHNNRHQNLTQKYVPRTFRDLMGQNLVAQALSNAVVKKKVGLLYVFYGPHGTGKTSCARIFARSLNCQSLEHPKPCGFCKSCVAHDLGKSRNTREVGPVSNLDFGSIMDLLDHMIVSQLPSQYRVFIFDDCDTLSPDCWSAISKVIDRAPRRVVFVLICSSLDVLPHIIISRCQKFFFPKLKDADIIYTLQWIVAKEDLEIEKDALKLIASRSDGSLRDAEMTLEQLSLLGQRISVPLVQELVGLISDEKLIDLLDLALSANTVRTVKNLREIMESGVEPLALMSQLATVITDILAGSYDFTKKRPRRKFFRQQALSKEDMEKLRQALKILSEAEKQLRMSNDRLTWLTAALLQLAPDQQYMLPSSSADTSFNHSPLGLTGGRERPRRSNVDHAEMPNTHRRIENLQAGSSSDVYYNDRIRGTSVDRKGHTVGEVAPQQALNVSGERNRANNRQLPVKFRKTIEEIWLEVLENIQINSLRDFLYQEGKLISVSFGTAPAVQLLFCSHLTKSKAEKLKAHMLQAFETVLGSPVTIEIRCESGKDVRVGMNVPLTLPVSQGGSSQVHINPGILSNSGVTMAGHDVIGRRAVKDRNGLTQAQQLQFDSAEMGRNEIVEIEASPREPNNNKHIDDNSQADKRHLESAWTGEAASSHKNSSMASLPGERKLREQNRSQSLVRCKVSLAQVIQQAEGSTVRNGWSKRKAVSIAEKLEQQNLRLEPRSRSLLCWKASRVTRQKLSHLKFRMRKSRTLLKFVSCGKCLSTRSPT